MTTLSAQIGPDGITAPEYATILQQFKIAFWSIYGSDANLDDDTQDGQFLAIFALAVHDANQAAIAAYNSFSPATAQGAALSSNVKINGIKRKVPSSSTATVRLVGVVGTQINGGVIGDDLNLQTRWSIPNTTIPGAGQIDVTATCLTAGAVTAGINTLTVILTPTLGWQTVTNLADAVLGAPVESDAALRRRQATSTAINAEVIIEAMYAAIGNLQNVSRLLIYNNDSGFSDGNGVPSHSVSAVVEGGDVGLIGGAIAAKKPPGTGTYGTTAVDVVDSHGIHNTIHFFVAAQVRVHVVVNIQSLAGYTAAIGDALRQAVVDYLNGLSIGEISYLSRLFTPANLQGTGVGAAFVVTSIQQYRGAGPPVTADVAIAFNEAAICSLADVTLNVT